jgi:hypothetical protein
LFFGEVMESGNQKIFCTGFNKTGTTTIKRCFKILELGAIAPTSGGIIRKVNNEIFQNNNYEPALKFAEQYDCFEDRPWNVWELYKHLDERFPDSKFILTVRNSESWWKSVERWISVSKPWMAIRYRQHLKAKDFLKESIIPCYEKYNKDVINYFAGSGKLLLIRLEDQSGWQPLCDFFQKEIPDVPFPHANRQAYDKRDEGKKNKELVWTESVKEHVSIHLNRLLSAVSGKSEKCFYCNNEAVLHKNALFTYKKDQSIIFRKLKEIAAEAEQKTITKPGSNKVNNLKTTDISDMAAVCCYINPDNSVSRNANFHRFYEGISKTGLKLIIVELVFNKTGSMLKNELDDVITVEAGDYLWSEEYLINIGIRELLRQKYEKIVWLNSEIIFEGGNNWAQQAAVELQGANLVQIYNSVNRIDKRGRMQKHNSPVQHFKKKWLLFGNQVDVASFQYGWAVRADVLKKVRLYDNALFCRGGMMLYAASFDYSDDWFKLLTRMTQYRLKCCEYCRNRIPAPAYTWHYLTWAQQWSRLIQGRVGYIDQEITDLSRRDKNIFQRDVFVALLKNGYDPENDIKKKSPNALEWSQKNDSLKREINSVLKRHVDLSG